MRIFTAIRIMQYKAAAQDSKQAHPEEEESRETAPRSCCKKRCNQKFNIYLCIIYYTKAKVRNKECKIKNTA